MLDWRGNRFTVGATVVYPSRHSSSVWMTEATIERIDYFAHEPREAASLTVRRLRSTRGGEIIKPVVKLTNLSDVLVIGAPNVKTADFNSAKRGLKL